MYMPGFTLGERNEARSEVENEPGNEVGMGKLS